MRTNHSRHRSLYQPSKSVYGYPRSPILRSDSRSPLKERKSVHFADSIFEDFDKVNGQLLNVYEQLKASCAPRTPEPKVPEPEASPPKPIIHHKKLSQPPPADYTKPTPEKVVAVQDVQTDLDKGFSRMSLFKSLQIRKQPVPVKAKRPTKPKRSNSVSRKAPPQQTVNIQQEFMPKRMNFSFRDSSFYQKLNKFYNVQPRPLSPTRRRK